MALTFRPEMFDGEYGIESAPVASGAFGVDETLPAGLVADRADAVLGGLPATASLEARVASFRPWRTAVKRAIDTVGSLLAIILLLPVMLLVATLVGVTSRGPIVYAQERLGRDGRRFKIFKFRSMRHDADARRAELSDLNEVSGPVFKVRADPRITPVGHWLRKLSIDELPQLFNVLIGQMSLVGPRPPIPEECTEYGPREMQRLLVKPGITCIWQVSGRSDLGFDTWVAMDLEYIRDWSLWLDLRLLMRTVPAVITGRGAY